MPIGDMSSKQMYDHDGNAIQGPPDPQQVAGQRPSSKQKGQRFSDRQPGHAKNNSVNLRPNENEIDGT